MSMTPLTLFVKRLFKPDEIDISKEMKMRVNAVLFDLFDTLLLVNGGDAFYEPALQKLHNFLVENGVKVTFEEFKRLYFDVRDSLYLETAETLDEPHFNVRLLRTLKRLGYNFEVSNPIIIGGTKTFGEEFMRHVSLDEDAVDVLQKLYGKYKLGIVSNLSIPECAWQLLEKFDLKKYFDVIVLSGDVNRRKPSPEIFQKALKALNIKASETIFIGDTLSIDIKGAKNIGINAILIKRKTSLTDSPKSLIWSPKEETQIKPDKIITSLKELLALLEDC
ncbi:MAG: HAD family hydrolase [Candidatus Bathyarchaeales archaeon]